MTARWLVLALPLFRLDTRISAVDLQEERVPDAVRWHESGRRGRWTPWPATSTSRAGEGNPDADRIDRSQHTWDSREGR